MAEPRITVEMVKQHWPYAVDYLVEILNGEYSFEEARSDLLSLEVHNQTKTHSD